MILKKSSSLTRSDIGTNFPWFLWQLKSFLFPIVPFVVPSICGSSCNRGKYFRPDNCCCKKTKSFTSLFGPSTTFTNSHFTSLSETLIVLNSLSLWSLLDVISYKLIGCRTCWTHICKCMHYEQWNKPFHDHFNIFTYKCFKKFTNDIPATSWCWKMSGNLPNHLTVASMGSSAPTYATLSPIRTGGPSIQSTDILRSENIKHFIINQHTTFYQTIATLVSSCSLCLSLKSEQYNFTISVVKE